MREYTARMSDEHAPHTAAPVPEDGPAAIDLLLTADERYLEHALTLLVSVRVNNPHARLRAFLLHAGIEQARLQRAVSALAGIHCELVCTRVEPELFRDAKVTGRYPPEMYFRLIAPHVLPRSCSRVLYLDPDTLVINPLAPLVGIDLHGKLFAAAAHTAPTEIPHEVNKVRLNTEHRYFNTGVLLMDVAALRERESPDEIAAFIAAHADRFILPDQDAFNMLYGDCTLEVPDAVWNLDARRMVVHRVASKGEVDMDWVVENTAIVHFCGKDKPWDESYPFRLGVLYKHYQQLAGRMLGQAHV